MPAPALTLEASTTVSPASADAAATAARTLARFSSVPCVRLAIENDSNPTEVYLPADIFGQVIDLLTKIANGTAVSIVPNDADLTTQQAAQFLNVSRPYIIKLIERGQLAHRMVGTHRKLVARDVLRFRDSSKLSQIAALKEMHDLDVEMGTDEDYLPSSID